MKKITLTGVRNPGLGTATFFVSKQEHCKGMSDWVASNGVKIRSVTNPAVDPDPSSIMAPGSRITLFLRGSDTKRSTVQMVVPLWAWDRIVAAVREFNRVHADRPAAAPASNVEVVY